MLEVFLDSLYDSLKVLVVLFIVYFLLSFVELSLSKLLQKNKRLSPLLGASFGLIPQCGFSVVSSDLYLKRRISMGTLLAVFIACSDEALPIMLSDPNKIYMIIPLLLIKFTLGFSVGYFVDFFIEHVGKKSVVINESEESDSVHIGCCHHEIDNDEENKWHKHLLHPLLHSLKIFIYVLVINLIFGIVIYYVGEDNIANFLNQNKYFGPLYSTIIGLIPNCASSVIITKMYLLNELSFGSALSGLIANAGLGLVILLKSKKEFKNTIIIIGVLVLTALIAGYLCNLFLGF